jgi:hypothetical protein
MVINPVGLSPEINYAGEAQQQQKTTDLTSHQRGRPHQQTHNCLKNNERKKEKN